MPQSRLAARQAARARRVGARAAARLARVKIYTRTGDDGTTGLLGPGRVPKSAPRVEAYGSVDELNAVPRRGARARRRGLARPPIWRRSRRGCSARRRAGRRPRRRRWPRSTASSDADVGALEALIDRLEADLPPLTSFILPGGTPLAAQLHLARTVCRRAERRVVALAGAEQRSSRALVRYLNRLADLLFVMARWCNRARASPRSSGGGGAG